MNQTIVRVLGPDDAPAYHALRLRGLREHPEAFTSSAEQHASQPLIGTQQRLTPDAVRPHDFFLGAFIDGVLAGSIGLEGRYRPKERHNATLVAMYVPLERSGTGLGRVLAQALVTRASAIPALLQIDLTVTAGNRRALDLYAHFGFKDVGVLPRAIQVDGVFHDKVRMQLQLR